MWPPSSWPTGSRFSAVMNRPSQPANASGLSFRTCPACQRVAQRELRGGCQHDRRAGGRATHVTHRPFLSGVQNHRRLPEPDQERRDCDHQPGERAGDRHVEQRTPVPGRRLHLDERAEGAQRERDRDEVRRRDADAVVAGDEVMPHLVEPEDRHERQRVGQAHREPAGFFQEVHALVCRTRPGRRQDREHEQQPVQPGEARAGERLLRHRAGQKDDRRRVLLVLLDHRRCVGDRSLQPLEHLVGRLLERPAEDARPVVPLRHPHVHHRFDRFGPIARRQLRRLRRTGVCVLLRGRAEEHPDQPDAHQHRHPEPHPVRMHHRPARRQEQRRERQDEQQEQQEPERDGMAR